MTEPRPVDEILRALQERAKELNCLYRIDEIVHDTERPIEELLRAVAEALPHGLAVPGALRGARRAARPRRARRGLRRDPVEADARPSSSSNRQVGEVCVYYTQQMPRADEGPFLKEERKLIDAAADRVARAIQHRELTEVFGRMQIGHPPVDAVPAPGLEHHPRPAAPHRPEPLQPGRAQDAEPPVVERHRGGQGAAAQHRRPARRTWEPGDENRPTRRSAPRDFEVISAETFQIAAAHLSEQELLNSIQTWIKEDRLNFLVLALESSNTSLPEIANALERYHHTGLDARELSPAMHLGLKVSLIRRLLTDNLEFINTCRPLGGDRRLRGPRQPHHPAAQEPRPGGRQGQRAPPGAARPAALSRAPRAAGRRQGAQDLVRALGRPPRSSSPTTTSTTSTTGSTATSTRSGRSTRTCSRSSRARASRPSSCRGSRPRSTTSATGR